ncbi:cobalamin biosynthesis protein [Streptomyces armeniacus]|uniref:cobalamin biosynthesis protein n=1 Tax=Streptomyces armeniacus TaxID=83291 RepID=UPI001FE8D340|nr:cobalamin biosynthesis protein [Streptomyces armeniacus]
MHALDVLGWPAEGAVREVARAVRDGLPVRLCADAGWPGDDDVLPPNVRASVRPASVRAPATPAYSLWVTDRVIPLGAHEAVLRPPSLTVGVGAARGVRAEEVVELIERALDDTGFAPASVAGLASVAAKADEPGLLSAAERFGVPLRTFPAEALAAVGVPGAPSAAARAAVGTPSVAEAAALYSAALYSASAPRTSEGGAYDSYGGAYDAYGGTPPPPPSLPVPKRVSAPDGRTGLATAAVARRPPESWQAPPVRPPHGALSVRPPGGSRVTPV